jgi:hypothetical protein
VDEEPTGGPDDEAEAAARRDEQRAEDEIIGLPWDDDLPVALGDDIGDLGDLGDRGELGDRGGLEAAAGSDPGDLAATGGAAGAAHDEDGRDEDGDDEAGDGDVGDPAAANQGGEDPDAGDDLGELYDDDHVAGRRNALPRRVESWRSRSATGAIATAIAMGLQQVFEPERRRPAAVAEAPSDPYDDDDPITVDYVPDDAEGTTVHVKPWLLQKGEPG